MSTGPGRKVAGCPNRGKLVPDDLVLDLVTPAAVAAADRPPDAVTDHILGRLTDRAASPPR